VALTKGVEDEPQAHPRQIKIKDYPDNGDFTSAKSAKSLNISREIIMEKVINSIEINGHLDHIFDLVTTTKYWPQWHPATVGVDGLTERPFTLHDQIIERAQIGPHLYEGTWTVVAWERPLQAKLQGTSNRIFITYSFQQVSENVTEFRRQLEYYPADFAASAPDPIQLAQLMHSQSQKALEKLKQLVEDLLSK
jgi:hypothetical protein